MEINNWTRKMIEENHQQNKELLFRKSNKIDKYLTGVTENKMETQSKWKMGYYFWFYRNRIIGRIDVNTFSKLEEMGKFLKTHKCQTE